MDGCEPDTTPTPETDPPRGKPLMSSGGVPTRSVVFVEPGPRPKVRSGHPVGRIRSKRIVEWVVREPKDDFPPLDFG